MRYLILSDIHANLTALDAVLEAAKGRWDKAACLGDLVGYGPQPNEVIERIKDLGATTIRGNHDKAVSGIDDAEDFNPLARHATMWTREQIHPANMEFLQNLPKGPITLDGFSIMHGAMHDEDEYVFGPTQALEGLIESEVPVSFFGHTHIQGGFSLWNEQVTVLNVKPSAGKQFSVLSIEEGPTYLVNPGSVGQPRDSDPRSAFAIADLDNGAVELWRVPYDIEAVQRRMTKAGLPEPLVMRLSFGR
jgi:predicted phosphodiesterase